MCWQSQAALKVTQLKLLREHDKSLAEIICWFERSEYMQYNKVDNWKQ